MELLWLIPLLPLASAGLLLATAGHLPRRVVALSGAGSVGLSALCVLLSALAWHGAPVQQHLWSWIQLDDLQVSVSFYLDGLSLTMMSVITGVGFLIHLYSAEFMEEDESFSRYFAYMNLFVGAMLILVMADNLLLLYLGWEGVGACSYLLVGFWYRDPANGRAARKAFVVTRVGDTAMLLGLLLLFTELGTLDIQTVAVTAKATWHQGDPTIVLATLLLLGGALGKSAQLPLHTWLPDAMAGPTPVSALIHAATMVTAGVYLIARTHELFLLAPFSLNAVALLGLATLLLAALTALNQRDIKRILAYSTMSQLGYMFLALGVGAWGFGVFHLVTHAFFKALLFLAAGAVIHCLHHEHDIFRMGGLKTRLPIVFWSFLIGSAALAALPFTAGFYSKDPILLHAYQSSPWLWLGGLSGALLTAIYSFRLVFIVFFGAAQTEPDKQPGWRMALPLGLLCFMSIAGGWIALPLNHALPAGQPPQVPVFVEWLSIGVPMLGVGFAYCLFLGRQLSIKGLVNSSSGQWLGNVCYAGWRIDALYNRLWVQPYQWATRLLRNEPVDLIYNGLLHTTAIAHRGLALTQNGRMRRYAMAMVVGTLILVGLLGGAT